MAGQTADKKFVERRKKIFVNSEFQGALLRQLFFNWSVVFGCIAAVLLAVESYRADFALDFYGADF